MALRSTRSAASARVSLVTSADAADVKPDATSEEPEQPLPRRSTRASTRLNLQRYAYAPAPSSSPRKRARLTKAEPGAEEPVKLERAKTESDEALTDLEDEPLKEVKGEARFAKASPRSKSGTPKGKLPLAAREKAHPAPARWYEQYQLIERMRAGISAPVDTMGCERPATMADLDARVSLFPLLQHRVADLRHCGSTSSCRSCCRRRPRTP